jgi:hypothetical protein
VIAAKFFNIYMKAFIKTLLGYNVTGVNSEGGALGVVKSYYGCVEAQGRGTLHCHMLLWIEGGLNPDEIKEHVLTDNTFKESLLKYLDDAISTCVPDDPDPLVTVPSSLYDPCSIRGINKGQNISPTPVEYQKYLHHLVERCQRHSHQKTCFKFCKASEAQECRFGLDSTNFSADSVVDPETGEINLKCLDGMVNNFNETILSAIRCNMDIKFIGSGASAKAILYYITDYISKTQLKAHVAYAALELAV